MLIKKAGTDNYVIPNGSTQLDTNDQLIIITKSDNTASVLSMLGASK